MFVTTIERTNEVFNEKARLVARELNLSFVVRNRITIKKLMNRYQSDCLVVGNDLVLYSFHTGQSVFFHPNLAQVRLKRILKGEEDTFLSAAMIAPGDQVLDCTLGFASDAIIAAHMVGNGGSVTGLEMNPIWAYILKQRLVEYECDFEEMKNALSRIKCLNEDYQKFLKNAPDKSFDIVYFDPMFELTIDESSALNSLKNFAFDVELTKDILEHAIRVARKRVVLKAHYQSPLFKRLGFNVSARKTSKVHFGFISII
ncbi:MAG: hypothetical protein K0R71_469 [Bacillales bacterium]|jgi:16S rRNA G966 N2-methylase RsmD|nr:hypothetical protein [Bacillales bacterium]